MFDATNPRERLVYHVQELERLQELKQMASDDLKAGFDAACRAGVVAFSSASSPLRSELSSGGSGGSNRRRADSGNASPSSIPRFAM